MSREAGLAAEYDKNAILWMHISPWPTPLRRIADGRRMDMLLTASMLQLKG